MSPAQRAALIQRYADGPALLEAAFARIPPAAHQWRPAPGKWSAHEVIVHCADSETNSHMRIRYLAAEAQPLIVGYDQDAWSTLLDYHAHPLEPAFATIRAVRANTVPLLRRLTEADWQKAGRHTEHGGPYGAETWLEIYAEHLEIHSRQLERNRKAWQERPQAG
jgi:DinB superfamily